MLRTQVCVAVMLACVLAIGSPARGAETPYDVDVILENDFERDFTNLPVFLQVFRVFGRGVDYAKLNPRGFHVYDEAGKELEFHYRVVPPAFSMANDELVVVLPKLAKGSRARLRFVNDSTKSARERPFAVEPFLANPNQMVRDGGFEKNQGLWKGGQVVSDVVRSGKNALMLAVPGKGGQGEAVSTQKVRFEEGRDYYFGVWARSENVTRHYYHEIYQAPGKWAGGRIGWTDGPLVLREHGDHFRIMDDREWYVYEANGYQPMSVPQPALKTVESSLWLKITQVGMAYLDAGKPARVWIDDILLFPQPKVSIDCGRIAKRLGAEGLFLYRRAATCMRPAMFRTQPLDPPRPYERITRLDDVAARDERKLLTLGIRTPKPIRALALHVSDLAGPDGAKLPGRDAEVEFNYTPTAGYKFDGTSLEGWVIDGNVPRNVDRPGFVDYLIAWRVPQDAKPGRYAGTIKVLDGEATLAELPVGLDVVDYPLKRITDRIMGMIYNAGCQPTQWRWTPGYEKTNGAVAPGLDDNYYRYYTRHNFNYMMMFARFLPFKGAGPEVDLDQLVAKMKHMRDVAGCTAGVGVYGDASLDKHGQHGLWPRSGEDPDRYRAEVKRMKDALAEAKLPPLMYMIWDEPRFFDEKKFGILRPVGALTTSDICKQEMYECLKRGGVFTHLSVDNPCEEFGPALLRYARKHGVKDIGFSGIGGPMFNRYEVGLMVASTGVTYYSEWHASFYIAYHPHHKAFVRGQNMVGYGEGMIDLRYHDTLRDAMAEAKRKGVAAGEVAAAEKYLAEIFRFCNGDMSFLTELDPGAYNGTAEYWGDDWFYDHWRARMRRHTLAILGALRGDASTTRPAGGR